jgi:hypothetical protein
MDAVDKLSYLTNDIKGDETWKTVPNILEMFLNGRMKYMIGKDDDEKVANQEEETQTE